MLDGFKTLSEDVVIYVLLIFPVKSLLRFKYISKTWCTLIQSSTFINLYLTRSTTTKDEFILFCRSTREEPNGFRNVMSIISGDNDGSLNPILSDLDIPHLSFTPYYLFNELIGPCNGLIVSTDNEVIILFNPSTKSYVMLPPSTFVCPKGFRHTSRGGVGFGFDPIGNDYKFIRISDISIDSEWFTHEKETRLEVYDLCIHSWRVVNYMDKALPSASWFPSFEILYNGAFHWYAVAERIVILCFDISTEIFRTINMPDACDAFDVSCYGLVVLNESLALICNSDPNGEINSTQNSMDIWIMIEDGANKSWTKKYFITLIPIECPLSIWRDQFLLFESKSGCLISYDLYSSEIKEFDLHGYPQSLKVKVYKENMTTIL